MATPAWFDYETYMVNKLAQLQADEPDSNWTYDSMVAAFAAAGFVGEEGAYNHFVTYGANEDVAPNAYFDADEYYYYKAAQYYETETPTELQVATLEQIIKSEGMNAWTHYVQYGSSEGINPSSEFDAAAYCAAKAALMNENDSLNMITENLGVEWTATTMAQAIANAGMTVLEHYLTYKGQGDDEVAADADYPVEGGSPIAPSEGSSYDLTTGRDTITGTNGDDFIYSINDGSANTLNAYDVIDGGDGYDALTVYSGQALAGAITNIEKLVLANQLTSATPTYDVSDFSDNVTIQDMEYSGGSISIRLNNVQKDISLEGIQATSNSNAVTLAATYASGVTESTINVSDSHGTDANSDDEAVTLNLTTGTAFEKLTLTGNSDVSFGTSAITYDVDASALDAGITAIFSSTGSTIVGGQGRDNFTISSSANTNLDSITTITATSGDTISGMGQTISDQTSVDISGVTSLQAAINTVLASAKAAGTYYFYYNNDTYIVNNGT